MLSMAIFKYMYCNLCTVLERQKCVKKSAHPWGCWIFRIQVENLTRGDSELLRLQSELCLHIIFKLNLVAKFINLPDTIQILAGKFFWSSRSKIAAHDKVEDQF